MLGVVMLSVVAPDKLLSLKMLVEQVDKDSGKKLIRFWKKLKITFDWNRKPVNKDLGSKGIRLRVFWSIPLDRQTYLVDLSINQLTNDSVLQCSIKYANATGRRSKKFHLKIWQKSVSLCNANIIFRATEERNLKNVKNCLNTNIYSYLETSCGQSSNLYLNMAHFVSVN